MRTVQGNQRRSQGLTATGASPEAAGMALPLGFSLRLELQCILHHWKLQYEIKSVGLWTAARVFLVTVVTGTRARHVGQKAGKLPRQR